MSPNKNSRRPAKRKSNKMLYLAIAIIALIIVAVAAYTMLGTPSNQQPNTSPTPTPAPTPLPTVIPQSDPEYVGGTQVLLHTSLGDVIIALRNDKPITTANFVKLVNQGTYNNTIFHRVIAGFMIQGGDPTGTGYGDPSIPSIPDEIGNDNHNYNGTIAMANTGQPNSASSQFFINVANNNNLYPSFDTSYTVFGRVVSGMNVVMAISQVQTNSNDKPVQNVTLIGANVLA